MNQSFMKERPILPLVLAMSIPNMLSMLVNSLYNIVDSWFVAKISEDAMTALSLVFPIQNISLAIAVGFSVGLNALIAFLMGRKREEDASKAANVGLILSCVHGIVLTAVCIFIMPYFLGLFSKDQRVIGMGLEYSNIVFAFCMPQHLHIAIEKVFQSVGRMKTSMFAMMAGCIANIILDPIFIFGMGPVPAMGITGAALATGLSQVLAILLYIVIYLVKPLNIRFGRKYLVYDKQIVKRMYFVGIPASLNMALPSLLISALNSILAAYSQVYIVVLGIYYKLQTFVYMPANGIIQGIRPLVGYNFGAREFQRVKKIYKVSLLINFAVMLGGTLICFAVPEVLMGMFSTNSETIEAGAAALSIIAIGFIPSAISITSCGSLEGLGMGIQSLIISLFRNVLVIIPLAFVLSRFLDASGVWHAFWLTEIISAAISYFLYHRVVKAAQQGVEVGPMPVVDEN